MNRGIWSYTTAHRLKPFYFMLACVLFFSLVACSQGSAPAQATATPQTSHTVSTPTPPASSPTPAPGTVLYTANWSHGLGNWHGSPGWSIVQGQLQVNSVPETTITIPYIPNTQNYAIEVNVQLIKVLKPADNQFYVAAQKNAHGDGFDAGFSSLYQPAERPSPDFYTGFIHAVAQNMGIAGYYEIDYAPGYRMRTYRVEVNGDQVAIFVDGARSAQSYSLENAFSNGPIVLDSSGLLLRIAGLRVIAL
jgi:hypothetical protein